MSDVVWLTSSFCESNACVEVAITPDVVLVRQSELGRYGPTLRFTHEEWAAFAAGMKAGEFEVPATTD